MKTLLKLSTILALCVLSQIGAAQKSDSNSTLPDSIRKTEITSSDAKINLLYYEMDPELFTGSAVIIKGSELNRIPSGNLLKQLQGLVPGLIIIGSGQSAESPVAFLRGPGNFTGTPIMFLVDGLAHSDISFLNPADIETITVLKDPAATSLFAGRAGYGVISVRTKKATRGIHINYNTSIGYQYPGKGISDKMLNTEEHARLQWLVYKNDNTNEVHPLYGPSTNSEPTLPAWAANTDWYEAITRPGALQNHSLSLSAASDWGKIYVGTWYNRDNGILLHNSSTRYSALINSELSLFRGKIKIGENFHFARREGRLIANLTEESPFFEGPFKMRSIIPVYIEEPIVGLMHNFVRGEFGGTGIANRLGNGRNVVANLARSSGDSDVTDMFSGNIYLSLELFKGFEWRTSLGGSFTNTDKSEYKYSTYENAENLSVSFYTLTGSSSDHLQLNSLASFKRQFSDNRVSITGGVEIWTPPSTEYSSVTRYLETGDFLQKNVLKRYPEPVLNWILSGNYSFKDKYLTSITLRSGKDELFYSASAGWRISEEKFLKNINWLNELKLRTAFGIDGNNTFKEDKTSSMDIGIDSRLLNNNLDLTIDYFSIKSDLLYPLPPFGDYYSIGKINNTGIEFGVKYKNTFGPIAINAGLTFTSYLNNAQIDFEFLDFGGSRIGGMYRCMSGYPVNSFFGYQVEGLFDSDSEVASAPQQDGAEPGFFRYVNTDTVTRLFNGPVPGVMIRREYIGPDDRKVIGNPNPDFTYGINLSLSYRNFDLSTFFYGSQGNDIFNYTRWWTDFWPSFQGQKSKRLLYESWTETNRNTSVPKASSKSNFSTITQISSYFIEDGSYLRLKSLTLGYTIGSKTLSRLKISSCRAYLQAANLFTLTKYSGIDPEVGGDLIEFGFDSGNYPNPKQFIIGIQLGI